MATDRHTYGHEMSRSKCVHILGCVRSYRYISDKIHSFLNDCIATKKGVSFRSA